jgi:polyhydroxybutyrate depolymerase
MGAAMMGVAAGVLLVLGGLGRWYFYTPMPPAAAWAAERRTVTVGGATTQNSRSRPPTVRAHGPVLLVLHGSLMNGKKMRRMLGPVFERLAERHGAVVVYPSGVEGHFNEGRLAAKYSARTLNIDDVGLVRAIVDGLVATHAIDRTRVFGFGYSNGGGMAMRLAVEAPELVAGIIVANANLPTPDNHQWALAAGAARAKVVLVEGTLDPINPYAGGRVTIFGFSDRGMVCSAPDSAAWFAQHAGLAVAPLADDTRRIGALAVRQQDWGSPPHVRLVTMQGAGHTVPQADYRFPKFLGATVQSDEILQDAWAMLDGR